MRRRPPSRGGRGRGRGHAPGAGPRGGRRMAEVSETPARAAAPTRSRRRRRRRSRAAGATPRGHPRGGAARGASLRFGGPPLAPRGPGRRRASQVRVGRRAAASLACSAALSRGARVPAPPHSPQSYLSPRPPVPPGRCGRVLVRAETRARGGGRRDAGCGAGAPGLRAGDTALRPAAEQGAAAATAPGTAYKRGAARRALQAGAARRPARLGPAGRGAGALGTAGRTRVLRPGPPAVAAGTRAAGPCPQARSRGAASVPCGRVSPPSPGPPGPRRAWPEPLRICQPDVTRSRRGEGRRRSDINQCIARSQTFSNAV